MLLCELTLSRTHRFRSSGATAVSQQPARCRHQVRRSRLLDLQQLPDARCCVYVDRIQPALPNWPAFSRQKNART
jgi:hypothetical protein